MPSQAPGDLATILGRNIRTERDRIELTQRQLADKIQSDPMLVSKWERGRHRPNDENLIALAQLFGRDVAWFYTDHPVAA